MTRRFCLLKILISTALLALFLMNINAVILGVRDAVKMCAFSIVPSLFVFIAAANMLCAEVTSNGIAPINPKLLVFIIGAVCGFPTGASVCDKLCSAGRIRTQDAARILPFVNNASPAFVIGTVGTVMLGHKQIGIIIYFSQLAASALLMLIFGKGKKNQVEILQHTKSCEENMFFNCIENAVDAVIKVCSLICFFSAILAIVKSIAVSSRLLCILSCFLEIGNASISCADTYRADPRLGTALAAFACGWSGICVHLQVFSVLRSIKVNKIYFVLLKLFQGALTSAISIIMCKILFSY